jgi:putative membrane protein
VFAGRCELRESVRNGLPARGQFQPSKGGEGIRLHGFYWSYGSTLLKQIWCSEIKTAGATMKVFLILAKALTALFWCVVLANLLQPFVHPFALLLNGVAAFILLIHALELWFFNTRIAARPRPAQERVQVMLFGIFQLLGLPTEQAAVAVVVEPQAALQVEVEHA